MMTATTSVAEHSIMRSALNLMTKRLVAMSHSAQQNDHEFEAMRYQMQDIRSLLLDILRDTPPVYFVESMRQVDEVMARTHF